MPGSLRISVGSHHCARGELDEFQSGTQTSTLSLAVSRSHIKADAFCKTSGSRMSFLTQLLVPFHCSVTAAPAPACRYVEQTQAPRPKARGSSGRRQPAQCLGFLMGLPAARVSGEGCWALSWKAGGESGSRERLGLPNTEAVSLWEASSPSLPLELWCQGRYLLERWFSPSLRIFRG